MTENKEEKVQLRKVLGIWDSAAYIICTIIGSGIFVSPSGVISETVSPGMALVMWAFTGIINLLCAACYAELSLTFPQAGSDYTYIREGFGALGDFFSFLFAWVSFVFRDASARGVLSLTFATYFSKMFFPECEPPYELVRIIAAAALTLLTGMQCYSSTWAVKTADFLTAAKLIGLLVIILSGFSWVIVGHKENITGMMDNSSTAPGNYALAFFSAFWAYSGIQNSMNVVEEMREPLYKNITYSIIISQITIMAVYLLTNFAYVAVLTPDEIVQSSAVAISFAQRVIPSAVWIIPFFVGCSTFGSLNGGIMNTSRLHLAATRQRHLPRFLGLLHSKFSTPVPILIINLLISLALLCTNGIKDLLGYASYLSALAIALSIISLLIMRFKRPDLARPFRLPIAVPAGFLCVLIVLLIFPLFVKTVKTLVCFAFIGSGIPVYVVFKLLPDTMPFKRKALLWEAKMTRFNQKAFDSLPEDESVLKMARGETKKGEDNPAFEMAETRDKTE